jgi:hypothetical protein
MGSVLPRNRLTRPTRDELYQEGAPVFQSGISNDNDKIVAKALDITPRHARNLKAGDCGTSWPVFILAAMDNPQLRDLIAKWLDLVPRDQTGALALADKIKRFAATLSEEGDQFS